MFRLFFFASLGAFLMSASLFYGLRLVKGFFGKRSDKYAKNMNTKQTITGNRTTTALKLPALQKGTSRSASRAGTRLHLLQLPKQSSVSFSVIASPQRAAASNRIWWLHTDKSSCCCCHSGCTFPTPSHESSGQDFYCLLYYCISRGICFKYALSLLPFVPMAFVPAFALPFALQISSPIFMYGVYYALLFRASFFFNPCFMCCLCFCCCCCVCRPEMPHFKKCFAFCFPTSCLVSVFVFVRLCIFCAVFFSNNRLARFAFPFSFPWCCCCFGVLLFGLLVSISPGCRLFVRYMQMCRQLFALRICFSRRSCYAYVFVF